MHLDQNTFTLVVSDIDGVLMDNSHRQHLVPEAKGTTQDWETFNAACVGDTPIQHMIDLTNYLSLQHGHFVVLCTGRTETCRDITLEMLARAGHRPAMSAQQWIQTGDGLNQRHPNLLAAFRGVDDHRKGWEYKADVLRQMIELYRPRVVVFIDDDPRNIQAAIAVCADKGVSITPITVAEHGRCPAVAPASQVDLAAIRYHISSLEPSLQTVREDLANMLDNAKEDCTASQIGLAEALDYLDECLGSPQTPRHSEHVAGWIAKELAGE